MHVYELCLEEFRTRVVVRTVLVQSDRTLLYAAPGVEWTVVFKCQISVHWFTSVWCVRLYAVQREIYTLCHQGILPCLWKVWYHKTLPIYALICLRLGLSALIFDRAVSGLTLSVEHRISKYCNLSIILVLLITNHNRASNVIINQHHVREVSSQCRIVYNCTSLYALVSCKLWAFNT
jgi:hypothetical protein